MAPYLLILLIASFVIAIICLALQKKRIAIIFGILSITMFLWIFTSIPVQLGLKKIPTIKFIGARALTEEDYKNRNINNADGIIEFTSDKELEKFDMERGNMLRLIGSNQSNFTYKETLESENFTVILESNDIYKKKNMGDKYLYEAMFYFGNPEYEFTDTIYCKVFLIQMFMPFYQTNEICVPPIK